MAEGLRLATLAREIGVDFPAAMTALGCGFEFQWIQLAAAAGAKYYARATVGAKYLILSNRELSTSQEKAWYRAYIGADPGTPGDPISITKTRADSIVSPVTTGVFETGTDVTGLTPIAQQPAFGGGAGASASGNETDEAILRIYPPGSVFTLEIENASASPADLHLHLYWWEVSANFLPPSLEV